MLPGIEHGSHYESVHSAGRGVQRNFGAISDIVFEAALRLWINHRANEKLRMTAVHGKSEDRQLARWSLLPTKPCWLRPAHVPPQVGQQGMQALPVFHAGLHGIGRSGGLDDMRR